jgi:hypothetical protein
MLKIIPPKKKLSGHPEKIIRTPMLKTIPPKKKLSGHPC